MHEVVERGVAAAKRRFTHLGAKKDGIFMVETVRFENFMEQQLQIPRSERSGSGRRTPAQSPVR